MIVTNLMNKKQFLAFFVNNWRFGRKKRNRQIWKEMQPTKRTREVNQAKKNQMET